MLTFITGGGRSGKSSFAENLACKYKKKSYLATAIAFDDEMKYRIKQHQKQRDDTWTTIEQFDNLYKHLDEKARTSDVVLLDCLSNLVSNIMLSKDVNWDTILDEDVCKIEEEIKKELLDVFSFINSYQGDFIIVSNEVGMGLVPQYALSRRFRDIAGRMNQLVAKNSDEAYLLVSGIPLKLK